MVAFYNEEDQNIYKTNQFMPQSRFLLDPYTPPAASEPVAPVQGGITNTNAFNNGGSGFSVYNPDPSSIVNRNYNPKPNYDAYYEDTFGKNLGDPEALGATGAKYADPSKLQGLASQAINFTPFGPLKKGLEFFGDYIPPNRRKIMENQLSGQGVMVNDIGQIVQGGGAYDTAGNIMAGYNASKVDADTFQKRRDMINDKMSDTNIDPNTGKTYKEARIAALDAAEKNFLDAQKKTDKIEEFEKEQKKKRISKNILSRIFKKKKATKNNQDNTTTDGGTKTKVTKTTNDGGDKTNVNKGKGTTETAKGGVGTAAYGQSFHHSKKDGGRAGYFFGGRVNYKQGGRVSFKNGGLASIL